MSNFIFYTTNENSFKYLLFQIELYLSGRSFKGLIQRHKMYIEQQKWVKPLMKQGYYRADWKWDANKPYDTQATMVKNNTGQFLFNGETNYFAPYISAYRIIANLFENIWVIVRTYSKFTLFNLNKQNPKLCS